jgi:hypothetical protein
MYTVQSTEAWDVLQGLAPHLDAAPLGAVVKNWFTPNNSAGRRVAEALWSEPAALRCRYFWYDMITPAEQDLVRNGDWAMFGLPTDDFSMALAQWWRAAGIGAETLGGRPVVVESRAASPIPLAGSGESEPKRQKEEAVFLDKLAVLERAAKLALYDILLILKKCAATQEGAGAGSRVRLEAARIPAVRGPDRAADEGNVAASRTPNRPEHQVGSATARLMTPRCC